MHYYGRFKQKEVIDRHYDKEQGHEGGMPIIDYDKDGLWYTMPIAEPVMGYIAEIETQYDYNKDEWSYEDDFDKPIYTIVVNFIVLLETFSMVLRDLLVELRIAVTIRHSFL